MPPSCSVGERLQRFCFFITKAAGDPAARRPVTR